MDLRRVTPAVERLRTVVACLVLTAVVFAQDGGRLVGDTKLDLTAAPGRLLSRGLHLWDPLGGAGQVQNQAYGYLFPLGPFHWLLQHGGLPDWAVQRVWQSLVLCTALVGVTALAKRLGLGTPSTRLLAGVAYALASRPVSQVGAISIEVWPYALAPWVLVPLVTGARTGSPRRAAALSGLAVLLVGGVNAAATLAVVPLGVLWLVVQDPGHRRRRLAGWWAVSVVCATAWWVGPLLLLGKYSPPFLDVIESASTTTAQTGLWSVLTGNDLWQQYLAIGEPARPAGFLLVTSAALVVCTTAVTALGLLGLLRRTTPHRAFLIGGVLLGLLVVGAGHTGALASPLAGLERDLLDGVLAPFRNVHKYDVLLRLPLALGLAAAAADVRLPKAPRIRPVAVLAALAVVGAASPALTDLQPRGTYVGLPDYWQQTADFLQTRDPVAGRAMVVPAAPFGDYAWGRPQDEPLQALARSPWVVRDAVPLGGPGVTRVLDVVEEVLRSGRGSPALAPFLARAGVRHLVVRNDLDANATGSTRPLVVHAALAASPGLAKVAAFGPPVGAGFGSGALVVDANLQPTYAAVEVFAVDGDSDLLATQPTEGQVRLTGGPEALLPLLEQGLVGAGTAVRTEGEGLPTLTDTYRDRESDVGRASDPASATLGAGTEARFHRPVHDYVPYDAPRPRVVLAGLTTASASSSASDADALLVRGRDHHPAAAFDGDGATSWVSGGLDPVGQWVQAAFARQQLTGVEVRAALVEGVGATATRVRVTTEAGSTDVDLPATLPLSGTTDRLRVTVLAATGYSRFGVVALEVGLQTPAGELVAQRGLVVPDGPGEGPVAVALTAGRRDRPGCLPVGDRPFCGAALPLGDEDDDAIDRTVTFARDAVLGVSVQGRVRPGDAVDALLQQGQPVTVAASSRLVEDPAARPAAVLDRDPRTAWLASTLDAEPTLTLTLSRPGRLSGAKVVVDPFLAASRPTALEVTVDGELVGARTLAADGSVRFPAVTGSVVRLRFPAVEKRTSLRRDGFTETLPVGVTEVSLVGVDASQDVDRAAPVTLPCGQGPGLAVDGDLRVGTSVQATVGDLLDAGPVTVTACGGGPLELTAGTHRLRLARTALLSVTSLTLRDLGRPALAAANDRIAGVQRWGVVDRRVTVVPGSPALLVVREAFNAGWTATLDGADLPAVRADGWQQAFVLPAAGGQVQLRFAPDRTYRLALAAGTLLALVLVGLAAVRSRAGTAPSWPRRRPLGPLLAMVAVVALGGLPGVAALAVAAAARRAQALSGVGALAAAGSIVAVSPWPDRALLGTVVQALCLLTVAVLAISLWSHPPAVGTSAGDPAPGPEGAAPAPPPPAARPSPRRGSPAPPAQARARSDR